MQNVFFLKKEDIEKFEDIVKNQLNSFISKDDSIAIKLHMGEKGNKYYIKPKLVKAIVKVLKNFNTKPFLFDSPATYLGERNTEEKYLKTAIAHGFSEKEIGCPIIISNESINFKTENLNVGVCKKLIDADIVLVLTHVKGHYCCGFGGAIKNLGMGALSKKTKADIHEGGEPVYISNCTLCGECFKACPLDNIRYDNNRPYFDKNWCSGCSNCVYACKYNALKTKNNFFDKLLAQGAFAAWKNFKKSYYINFIINIAKTCDCDSGAELTDIENIGILFSKDIIAIEKASFDLINKKTGKDFFKELHKKSPLIHINEAYKLKMGELDYNLIKL